MSQAYLENNFPLEGRPEASGVRHAVINSLYGENVNPLADNWSDDAIIYVRSSWLQVKEYLDDHSIVLTPDEESELINFCSDYASMVDSEEDFVELTRHEKE